MTESIKIRALVVDDELSARRKIRKMLSRHADVEIVGECVNGYEAVSAIKEHAPDLIFLDVEMPGENDGFYALEGIKEELRPLVIFVTGYDKYAKAAFDVHAVDFLSKPFDRKRFDEALSQAKLWLESRKEKGATAQNTSANYRKLLGFKAEGRVFFLNTDKIKWIKAEGKYVRIYFDDKSPLLREPISTLTAKLDPDKFLLINRSYIVNINYVQEIQHLCKQKYVVVLRDGTELDMSDSGRKRLAEQLGISL